MSKIEKNNRKTIRAWAIFDWANSSYSLVISTAIFPVYYTKMSPRSVNIVGYDITSNSLFTFAVSAAYIFLAIISPLLSGIADYSGRRKLFLRVFTIIGAFACMSMFFFKGEAQFWVGTISFILATIGFAGGLVFYDSFLPLIVTEDRYDKVSAKGFAYGYVGSVILLMGILSMILKPNMFGITDSTLPDRLGFLFVGLWWLGFAQYTLYNLPKDNKSEFKYSTITKGYYELIKVLKKAIGMRNLKLFLTSLFLYYAGVQTVVYVATIFATKEIHMESEELIMVVLIIQLIGIVGAYLFAYISNRIGNKRALLIQIVIWTVICFLAFYIKTKTEFYYLAGMVGMVVGGIQSLSRSSYSKLLPKNEPDVTSFFSLYDVLFKLSIVVGTFLFGFVNQVTQDMRFSVLTLGILFILGFIVMLFVSFENRGQPQQA